uniref:G protein-coupled receptor n=1 Tax=Steinernema glaseri TaxID=37863 RepID=A0A1I7YXR8_9BILA
MGFVALSAVSTVICDGSDAFRFLFMRQDYGCPIPLYSGKTAEILMMPSVFCVNALGIMFIFVGVERAIATIFTERYEKMKSTAPGWILLFIAVSMSFAKALWFWSKSKVRPARPMVTIGEVPFYVHYVTLGMQLLIEVINIILFTGLYLCNKRRKHRSSRVASSLGYKYQLNENFQSVTHILQLAWIHCVIIFSATIVIFCAMFTLTEEQGMRLSPVFDLYALYHCVLPVVLGYRTFREKFRRRCARVDQKNEHKDYQDQDQHFKMLQNLFDKPT